MSNQTPKEKLESLEQRAKRPRIRAWRMCFATKGRYPLFLLMIVAFSCINVWFENHPDESFIIGMIVLLFLFLGALFFLTNEWIKEAFPEKKKKEIWLPPRRDH